MADQLRHHQYPAGALRSHILTDAAEYFISYGNPILAKQQSQHFRTAFLSLALLYHILRLFYTIYYKLLKKFST